MIRLRNQILKAIEDRPGLTDREITNHVRSSTAPQQPINQQCRLMQTKGLLERRNRPDGLIGNFPIAHKSVGHKDTQVVESSSTSVVSSRSGARPQRTHMSEDGLKEHLQRWLQKDDWEIEIAWGKSRGSDIVAKRQGQTWIIEAKGTGSRPPMFNNYFLGVLGEILQRMNTESAKYSIALPMDQKFLRLWQELPKVAKRRSRITALFVNSDGAVVEQD